MAHLVRHHVGPGEVAGGVQLLLHVLVEGEVEVDPVVGGAVEGANGRGGTAATAGVTAPE